MILEPYDEQLALDYTIYMMMGSFFDEAQPASVWKEKILKLRYQLLPLKAQYTIEEACERYFENEILPELPGEFLKGKATVHWMVSENKKYTAVVFSKGKQQLWIASLYGGRYKTPIFEHWTVGIPPKEVPAPRKDRKPKGRKKNSAA